MARKLYRQSLPGLTEQDSVHYQDSLFAPLAKAISVAVFVGPLAGSITAFYTSGIWYQVLIVSGLASGLLALLTNMVVSYWEGRVPPEPNRPVHVNTPMIEESAVKEKIRFIPFNNRVGSSLINDDEPTETPTTDNDIALEDLAYFVKSVGTGVRTGGQAAWRKVHMPSGEVCTPTYHREIIKVLESSDVWVKPDTVGEPARLKFDWQTVVGMLGLGEYL